MNQAFWRTAAGKDRLAEATAGKGVRPQQHEPRGGDGSTIAAAKLAEKVDEAAGTAPLPWPQAFHPWHAERGGEWHRRGG